LGMQGRGGAGSDPHLQEIRMVAMAKLAEGS
jgi:hypothetical protein